MTTSIAFDPFSAEFIADPYPSYHALQDCDPVHWCESLRAWLVTRHTDVGAVLHDERFSSSARLDPIFTRLPAEERAAAARLEQTFSRRLSLMDLPGHTRPRGLMSHAFAPRVLRSLESGIRARAHALVDRTIGA